MSLRFAISLRRSCPLPSTFTSRHPGLMYSGESTIWTPVHTGVVWGFWSQTRNLVVSICPHPVGTAVELADIGEIICLRENASWMRLWAAHPFFPEGLNAVSTLVNFVTVGRRQTDAEPAICGTITSPPCRHRFEQWKICWGSRNVVAVPSESSAVGHLGQIAFGTSRQSCMTDSDRSGNLISLRDLSARLLLPGGRGAGGGRPHERKL